MVLPESRVSYLDVCDQMDEEALIRSEQEARINRSRGQAVLRANEAAFPDLYDFSATDEPIH